MIKNGVVSPMIMTPKKSMDEQFKEIEVLRQQLKEEREQLDRDKTQFDEDRKIIFDSLSKCIGSGSANIGKNISKALKKAEKVSAKKQNNSSSGSNHSSIPSASIEISNLTSSSSQIGQSIGTPFNVQHKVHVDFDYKWTSGQDFNQVFEFLETLGTGSYGTVHKAIHKDTNFTLATKVIPIQDSEEIEKEISILKKCKSPNIVSYFGSCHQGENLWILMDYCSLGSIRDMLDLSQKTLSEKQVAVVVQQALKGLHYLHSNQIIHRDIKAANILLNDDATVKLADFGVSAQLDDAMSKSTDFIGTPLWMPPEIIQKKPYNNKVDLWSLGITIIEMLESYPPYWKMPPTRAMLMIPNKQAPTLTNPSQYSKELNDFLSLCCQKDPEKRPSALELLSHPWMAANSQLSNIDVLRPIIDECLKKASAKKKKTAELQKKASAAAANGSSKDKKDSKGSAASEELDEAESFNTFILKTNNNNHNNNNNNDSSSSEDEFDCGTMITKDDDQDTKATTTIPAFIAALKKTLTQENQVSRSPPSNPLPPIPNGVHNKLNSSNSNNSNISNSNISKNNIII